MPSRVILAARDKCFVVRAGVISSIVRAASQNCILLETNGCVGHVATSPTRPDFSTIVAWMPWHVHHRTCLMDYVVRICGPNFWLSEPLPWRTSDGIEARGSRRIVRHFPLLLRPEGGQD